MKILVLDHGYVEFIEAWGQGKEGDDTRVEREHGEAYVHRDTDFEVGIVEAARQSTQGSFRGWDEDKKLLNTLFHHQSNQSTPFEMAGMVIEVQAPIFVFREWHRHRTQSYNEMSGRYTQMPDLYYVPDTQNVLDRADRAFNNSNKQLGSLVEPDHRRIKDWIEYGRRLDRALEEHYQHGLERGVPKELARIHMPVNHYSRMRASANLRNWLAFLTLRLDPKAQEEIRVYAEAVGAFIKEHFPHTWALFENSRKPQ